ncbi:hypothetical protein Syun_026372 [Stephania yunnanensis]|uniref:Serine aminopeptidase S33 domain-containing protein n=1 Tax=Stephania yunnanensis TaxID=152371 RepID=A0AAP0HVN9_9MAGN
MVGCIHKKHVQQKKITLQNNSGQKLVGVLHETGSVELVVLCHGFQSSKECKSLVTIASALEKEGTSSFRFDFVGNGYHDVPVIVNISGRFNLEKGMEGRLGKDFMQRIKQHGYIDVFNRKGKFEYRVTEESLMDRLATHMAPACLTIEKDCRVLTVHGASDRIVPAKDAFKFEKLIPNHKLHIIEGADHEYTSHQAELASIVLQFIKEGLQHQNCDIQPRLPPRANKSNNSRL